MKKTILYGLWAALYALCAGLSFITNPSQLQAGAMTVLSVLFFVPGGLLLLDARRSRDKKTLLVLRWISSLSLGLTLAALIANIASVTASSVVGDILHYVLIFVSVPMLCSHFWVLSLFLWACLLFAGFPGKDKA